MAATATKNLFLQISGSADGLAQAARAARVSMAEIGAASGNLQDVVAENFRKLGGSEVTQTTRQLEASFKRTFSNIRASAEETLSKPITAATIVNTNVRGAEQAVAAAESQAASYRDLADAQARLVQSNPAATEGERRLAVALETAALSAQQNVGSLQQEVVTLRTLREALGGAGDEEEELAGKHARMGSAGLIAEHVVRALSDSIAAGQSPVRAFTMELGRITEAMTFFAAQTNATEGALGKFAGFMGGPWGLAISVGVALLAPLVEQLFEAGDAAEKAKKAEEDYANFQGDLANFIDTANGKLRERLRLLAEVATREGADKIKTAQQNVEDLSGQTFSKARDLGGAGDPVYTAGGVTRPSGDPRVGAVVRAAGGDIGKLVDGLVRLEKAAPDLASSLDPIIHLGGRALFARQDLAKQQGDQAALQVLLGGGSINNSAEVERRVADRTANTPLERAQSHLRDVQAQGAEIDKLPEGAERTSRLAQFEKDLTAASAALRTIQAQKHDAYDNRQIGRQISLEDAEAIVRGIGGRVTSARRSTAEQAELYARYQAGKGPLAAKPGTSLHEQGEALDIAKSGGVTLATLKKAFEQQGVHLTELLDEGDHFHVGFGNKGQKAEQSQAYDLAAANAKLATATDDVSRAEAQLDLIRTKKLSMSPAEYQAALTQAEANLNLARSLKTLDEEVPRDIARDSKEGFRTFERENPVGDVHKDIDQADKGRSDATDYAFQHRASAPIDQYRANLQEGVGDLNHDLSTLEVSSIDHLGEGLETAAQKALNLHGILGQITADLLKMVIQREIELPIANALTGGGGGGGGGIFASLGKLFGGGRAVGGGVSSSNFYLVGEKGPELFAPGMSGTIIPNHALNVPSGMRDLSSADMRALAPAQPQQVLVQVQANDYFDARVHGIAAGHAAGAEQRATQAGADLASERGAWASANRMGSH